MIELGVSNEDAIGNQDSPENKPIDQEVENVIKSEQKDTSNVVEQDDKSNQHEENDHESIESVQFISQPVRKKSTRSKKSSD